MWNCMLRGMDWSLCCPVGSHDSFMSCFYQGLLIVKVGRSGGLSMGVEVVAEFQRRAVLGCGEATSFANTEFRTRKHPLGRSCIEYECIFIYSFCCSFTVLCKIRSSQNISSCYEWSVLLRISSMTLPPTGYKTYWIQDLCRAVECALCRDTKISGKEKSDEEMIRWTYKSKWYAELASPQRSHGPKWTRRALKGTRWGKVEDGLSIHLIKDAVDFLHNNSYPEYKSRVG